MRAVDCQGFAGGFTLGVAQAGWEIVGKVEGKAGFGVPLVEGNRHLVGDFPIVTLEPHEWPTFAAEFVFGNPPCSGFSALSVFQRSAGGERQDGRGMDSHLNQGMYDLIDYAARVKPDALAFESVEAAGRKGRELMVKLRGRLEEASGLRYNLTHVFQDNASIGGRAIRRRYHMVAHRFDTLGMDDLPGTPPPTLAETIGDLADKPLEWEGDPDGHVVLSIPTSTDAARIAAMASEIGRPWLPREKVGRVTCRLGRSEDRSCFDCRDGIDHDFAGLDMSWVRNIHRKSNLYAVVRWPGDAPARVVTGGFLEDAIHPWLDRTFTYREEARIQGFPDDWTMSPARQRDATFSGWAGKSATGWLGKGIPVQAGRWIASGVKRSLEGDPGPLRGREIGSREWEIDVIGAWRKPLARQGVLW